MIGEKIINIMSEINPIEKTELDEEKNYKYAKIRRRSRLASQPEKQRRFLLLERI